ncbi:ATP-dependent metallopeptidase FtsH/Yme1/Tma family protein [Rhodohalobacter sp. SW132]|uniref:ATP-dependent zinc metalloprotease FtsH n=1 Tax=Rhodohalobacter sp. SW132 TaxID=2293433 RepID=UPI000E281D86|nr:ATP-dependent zinc metalloprotease FtsH [Rhodohalobacter sp. SW132]REL33570.1 ATP-dependent metallopeptidase FtsH/Yme1/Tma family protein [Rhodohalobacter sp. SW132]
MTKKQTSKNSSNSGSNKNEKKKAPRFPIWIYVVLFLVLIGFNFLVAPGDSSERIKYSEFLEYVQEGYVQEILIINNTEIEGEYSEKAIEEGIVERPEQEESRWRSSEPSGPKFTTTMLEGDEVRAMFDEYNVVYDVRVEENWWSGIFIWLIPIALIIAFWIFIFKRMNPGQQVLNIGKNKASLYDKQTESKVSFQDVAGLEEAKAEVEEVVEFLSNPKKFTNLGGSLPKGVLLVGPPGTGKTLLAKATAGEADVPFFSLSGSDFVEMFVGVGAARVRDLFKQAKEKAPCIVFIDEIDSIGRSRGSGMQMNSNDERENTLNQLLSEMDGFNSDNGVIIMAATNRPDVLDSALLRPGRFDRQILIDKPDLKGRMQVLEVHVEKLKLSDDIDLKVLASQTPGFAGAELANLCNEAALMAARRNKKAVEMVDFQDSIERVVAGLEKKNKLINPNERKIVAYHEAGHAIVGWYLEHTDTVLKVSIVPRGLAALGYTLQTPLEDRFLMTTEELNDKICALLGGRVAEEIIFGKISTGAQNDLERITTMAFAMVAEYGMSEELGYLSLKDSNNPNNSYGFNKKYSEKTAQRIDMAIQEIIKTNYKRTFDLLKDHQDKLEKMAETLLDKEVINHHDIRDLLGDRPTGNYPEGIFETNDTSKKAVTNGSSSEEKEKKDKSNGPEQLDLMSEKEEEKSESESVKEQPEEPQDKKKEQTKEDV